MRRADRLFQIIQVLRRSTRPVTAAALAEELEVSRRTVYRDIRDLMVQRVPIAGEAGLGYLLSAGFDMPPLMLTADELEAVALGAQWVMGYGDRTLADAARDVIAKIAAVVPQAVRPHVVEPSVGVKAAIGAARDGLEAERLRAAIRGGRKVRLRYRSQAGQETERTVHPVVLGYSETGRVLIAWCETRGEFRHFRTDRIIAAETLPETTGLRPGALRGRYDRWRARQVAPRSVDGR